MSVFVRKPSYKLTFDDAVTIWAMYRSGHFQNRIAAHFDVNPGRISEIIKGHKYLGSREEARKRRIYLVL